MISLFNECVIRNMDDLMDKVPEIEKMFRKSHEYRLFLKYMKEELKLRSCNFFCNIDFVDNDLTQEMHHLITLYDVCVIAGRYLLDQIDEGQYITTFDVAKEVFKMHYEDLLPVVMLSKTIHEMVHADLYEVKPDTPMLWLGDYNKFYNKYGKYFLDDHFDLYKKFNITFEEKEEH